MSQNPNGETKYTMKPLDEVINDIYECKNISKDNSDKSINPNSARLYFIADNIAEARSNHLKSQTTHRAEIENKFIKSISKMLLGRDWYSAPLTERALISKESAVGASIFGSAKPNERREFWNDNRNSWFFHQSITTQKGVVDQTFHYEVHPTGVLRVVNENVAKCAYAHGDDLKNFLDATETYYGRVMREVYGIETTADKKTE